MTSSNILLVNKDQARSLQYLKNDKYNYNMYVMFDLAPEIKKKLTLNLLSLGLFLCRPVLINRLCEDVLILEIILYIFSMDFSI